MYLRIITCDILRTRVNDKQLLSYKDKIMFNIELKILIYSLIYNDNCIYKQGLNEIFGAFLFLKDTLISTKHIDNSISNNIDKMGIEYEVDIQKLNILYNLASGFLNKYLINYYKNSCLITLKSSFILIEILLKYHDPELQNYLKYHNIYPELYCTSWILTYFASKLRINNVLYLWNIVINLDDEIFIFYFIVAYLIYYRCDLLELNSEIKLLQYIGTNMNIDDILYINDILIIAVSLIINTPYSYKMYISKLKLFNPLFDNHKDAFERSELNKLEIMPILTSEVLKLCYPNLLNCWDNKCKNYIKSKKLKNKNNNSNTNSLYTKSNKICSFCKEYNLKKDADLTNITNMNCINKNNLLNILNNIYNTTAKDRILKKINTKYFNYSHNLFDNLMYIFLKHKDTFNNNNNLKENLFQRHIISDYVIIDLKNTKNKEVFLPLAMPLNINEYNNRLFSMSDLVNKFQYLKGKSHFIIITEELTNLSNYININNIRQKVITYKRKSESSSKLVKLHCLYNLDNENSNRNKRYTFNRTYKNLNITENSKDKINDSENIYNSQNAYLELFTTYNEEFYVVNDNNILSQFNSSSLYLKNFNKYKINIKEKPFFNFINIINKFIVKGFNHISFAYKGFEDIHNKCIDLKLKLINHNAKLCNMCPKSNLFEDTDNNKKKSFISNNFYNRLTNIFTINTRKSIIDNSENLKNTNRYIKKNILTKDKTIIGSYKGMIRNNSYSAYKYNQEKSLIKFQSNILLNNNISKEKELANKSKEERIKININYFKSRQEVVDNNNNYLNNDFPGLNDLADNEYLFETLSVNYATNLIEMFVIYIYYKEIFIFKKKIDNNYDMFLDLKDINNIKDMNFNFDEINIRKAFIKLNNQSNKENNNLHNNVIIFNGINSNKNSNNYNTFISDNNTMKENIAELEICKSVNNYIDISEYNYPLIISYIYKTRKKFDNRNDVKKLVVFFSNKKKLMYFTNVTNYLKD